MSRGVFCSPPLNSPERAAGITALITTVFNQMAQAHRSLGHLVPGDLMGALRAYCRRLAGLADAEEREVVEARLEAVLLLDEHPERIERGIVQFHGIAAVFADDMVMRLGHQLIFELAPAQVG